MADYTTRTNARTIPSYVPAVEEILSPPPPPPEFDPRPVQPDNSGLGFIITSANVLVTAIIIIGMLLDGRQVGNAIITGAVYFAVTTVVYMFVITGALSAIIGVWQRERTERSRIDAYADIAEMAIQWRLAIEKNRALELQAQAPQQPQLPTRGVQTPNGGRTFVPPYDKPDKTAREALEWARGLYLENGQPDPDKVVLTGEKQGWLRIRMLGSKRDEGSREAGLWLLHRKVIVRDKGHNCRLNLRAYPTREHLRALG